MFFYQSNRHFLEFYFYTSKVNIFFYNQRQTLPPNFFCEFRISIICQRVSNGAFCLVRYASRDKRSCYLRDEKVFLRNSSSAASLRRVEQRGKAEKLTYPKM